MKQTIYIRRINKNLPLPQVNAKGDGIDLYASETVTFKAPQSGTLKYKTSGDEKEGYRNVTFDIQTIKLGVAMLLPDGMEADLINRSSTGKKLKISLINGFGLIDGGEFGFNGNDDEWRFPAIAWDNTTIEEGTAFCQFLVRLSPKATFWEKLKWLFSDGIEIVEVDELPNKNNRGGGCIRVESK